MDIQHMKAPMASLTHGVCRGVLWVHKHFQTNEPLQVDAIEWYGRVDVLDRLLDDAKISEIDLTGIERESWVSVEVEYEWEDGGYSLRLTQAAQ